jgi:hypothetical protein
MLAKVLILTREDVLSPNSGVEVKDLTASMFSKDIYNEIVSSECVIFLDEGGISYVLKSRYIKPPSRVTNLVSTLHDMAAPSTPLGSLKC